MRDVIVIGAGGGGPVVAKELAQRGLDVLLLEAGPRHANPEQEWITSELIALARQGHSVVRLKGGDPFIFGRGGEELADLVAAGIEVVVVSGVSSAIAAPAAAGIPLTLRDVASSVGVISGHSAHAGAGLESVRRLASVVDTLVVLMPLGRLGELTRSLAEVLPADRPAAVIASATTSRQTTTRAPLDRLAAMAAQEKIEGPAVLVVGEVVDALPRSRLQELFEAIG